MNKLPQAQTELARDKAAVQRPAPQQELAYPIKLVELLSKRTEFAGIVCGLEVEGAGWQESKFDGVWNAVLRRSFGENEVSCLLESSRASEVEKIELEAEFHQPGLAEDAMIAQFSQSAQVLMFPSEPPVEFVEAVLRRGEWSDAQWQLTRVPYANGGFGLLLRRKSVN